MTLSFETIWSKPLVAESGGESDLMIRITAGAAPVTASRRAPVDVAFIIDRSGSMGGGKLETAKQGVTMALGHLDQQDRAALVMYDNEIDLVQELSPVSAQAKQAMAGALRRIEPRGSTNLGDGWLSGCQQIARAMHAGAEAGIRVRRAILLTDGQANVGMTDPGQLSHHAGQIRTRGVSTTTLGFGEDFDEQLLTAMAEAGGGNFEYIATPEQLVPFFTRELGELLAAVATGITLRLTLPAGVRGELISRLPHERHGKTFEIVVGDLPAGESVDLLFHLTTRPGKAGELLPVPLRATWNDAVSGEAAAWEGEPVPLMRSSDAVVAATASDPGVAEKVALQRAANAQREAMLLDRQGRHGESRRMLMDTAALLQSAPQTDRVRFEHAAASQLADYDASVPFAESDHKRTASRASRMVRGRRDREENVR
jgi:Ca-activated chloride channel family protein